MKRMLFVLILATILNGCAYKFSGASTTGLKTVSVQYFENNAPLVVPYLSQEFTEALKIRIRNQTKLGVIENDANARFEGRITNYSVTPVAITDNKNPTAGATRMTITVQVKYTNTIEPERNFEQTFDSFKNFTLTGTSLQVVERQLIKDINAMLTEKIFNAAFSQW